MLYSVLTKSLSQPSVFLLYEIVFNALSECSKMTYLKRTLRSAKNTIKMQTKIIADMAVKLT